MRYQGVIALACVVLLTFISSCATTKDTGAIPEDELIVTRKYVGNFLDYRHTAPERVTDPHIVWIKTTQDSIYGKLSILSRECEFEEGDRLFLRRKYVGNFLDYRHTPPERVTDPHIVWIKTTQDSIYGKLSVLSKECEFEEGDRLFLRRKYVTPGVWGYWEYQIENDKKVFYKLSEFQHDRKVPVQSLF